MEWVVAVDSTIVRAPRHAAGARQRAPAGEPADHALRRSCGGLTPKVHLAANSRCRPPAFVLTSGQADDAPAFEQVMTPLGCHGESAGPESRQTWSWRTRRTRPGRSAVTCNDAESGSDPAARRPGRQRQATRPARRPPVGLRPRGQQAAEHPANAASASSGSGAASPPATTRPPPPTSPPSSSGQRGGLKETAWPCVDQTSWSSSSTRYGSTERGGNRQGRRP